MIDNDAILSADARYRYVLSRGVVAREPNIDTRICLWVMVNPSTADALKDDHTIRKVTGYCHRWGFARFRVVNLYAYRATDIGLLHALEWPVSNQPAPTDIVGPDNDRHISEQAALASEIIVAWGNRSKMPPSGKDRIHRVLGLLRGAQSGRVPVFCIGRTQSGDPKHPLTTPYSAPRVRFED